MTPKGWYSTVAAWLRISRPGDVFRGPSTLPACLAAQVMCSIASTISSCASECGLPLSAWTSSASWPMRRVRWVRGDALRTPPPAASFDLVSMQYPALPEATGEAAVRALLGTVRHGGLLLAVYHALDDEHREHMKSRASTRRTMWARMTSPGCSPTSS